VSRARVRVVPGRPLRRARFQLSAVQDGLLQRPFDAVMPRPGLCRVLRLLVKDVRFLTVPDAA
jgi:hypothetical protein